MHTVPTLKNRLPYTPTRCYFSGTSRRDDIDWERAGASFKATFKSFPVLCTLQHLSPRITRRLFFLGGPSISDSNFLPLVSISTTSCCCCCAPLTTFSLLSLSLSLAPFSSRYPTNLVKTTTPDNKLF